MQNVLNAVLQAIMFNLNIAFHSFDIQRKEQTRPQNGRKQAKKEAKKCPTVKIKA